MTDNPLKKLAQEVLAHEPKKPPTRVAHTIKMNEELYRRIVRHCQESDIRIGEFFDRLMQSYLDTLDKLKEDDKAS